MPLVDEDSTTLEAVRRGSREAFRDIVERHGQVVFAVLTRLVGSAEAAEELAQETFVRAYEGLERFRGESRLRTWLLQIAINLARDRKRAARRSPRIVSLDQLRESGHVADAMPDAAEPEDPVSRRELFDRLELALRALPRDYREAFVLRHVEELPYETIARMTGQSVGCLKVRVHRSRARLRAALSEPARREKSHGRFVGSLL